MKIANNQENYVNVSKMGGGKSTENFLYKE